MEDDLELDKIFFENEDTELLWPEETVLSESEKLKDRWAAWIKSVDR